MKYIYQKEYKSLIEKAADRMKKENQYIHSFGVELEGGVSSVVVDEIEEWIKELGYWERFECGSDGSVNVAPPFHYRGYWYRDAEIRFWTETEKIELLLELIWRLWREGFKQNSTCGNHIHVKFYNNSFILSLIFNEKFVDMFQRKYEVFAKKRGEKYIERIHNSYCKFYDQVSFPAALYAYQHSRYYAVNYCSVDENDTLEIRILPYCDSAKEFIENLIWLNKTLNKIIDKFVRKERIMSLRIAFPKEEVIKPEEIDEEVIV